MADIVERLRERAEFDRTCYGEHEMGSPLIQRMHARRLTLATDGDEAADEITRLRSSNAKMEEALRDAVAHLAGAASAYRKHASRHKSHGRAAPDALFSTRVKDFDNAVERGRSALSSTGTGKG